MIVAEDKDMLNATVKSINVSFLLVMLCIKVVVMQKNLFKLLDPPYTLLRCKG